MELKETHQQALDGLRSFIDHLEANPELIDLIDHQTFYVFHYGNDVPEFARKALLLGTSRKSSDSDWFNVERKFGPLLTVQVSARHEAVCEKIVTDTQEVEVEELDPDLVKEALANVPMRKVTKTVEQFEWKCPPSLVEAAKS